MHNIRHQTAARLSALVEQPAVLGMVLIGSRSRGFADELSDDDVEVILSDQAFAALPPTECGELGHEDAAGPIYDLRFTSLGELRRKGRSPYDRDHWQYEWAQLLFERDGRVRDAVTQAARMDGAFRRERLLYGAIDAWMATQRAPKTFLRGMEGSGRLVVVRGALALARVLFALEWRWTPPACWIEAELGTLPDRPRVVPVLIDALRNGDPARLCEAFDRLEDRLWTEGVPRAGDRRAWFLGLVHPSRALERAQHELW